MIKKSLVLALVLLGSQVYADVTVDSVAAVVADQKEEFNADLLPQTVSQQEFFEAGKSAAEAVLKENPNATPEDVLKAVEAAYGTVALRGNEKFVWACVGAVSALLVYFGAKFIYNTIWPEKAKKDGSDCNHGQDDEDDQDGAPKRKTRGNKDGKGRK